MNTLFKNLALWLILFLVMITLWNLFKGEPQKVEDLVFSDFMTKVEDGSVTEVTVKDQVITGLLADKTRFRTYAPEYPELIGHLRDRKVRITAKPPEEKSIWMVILLNTAPFILLIILWVFFMRQMQVGGKQGPVVRQEQGPPADREPAQGDLQGRGRRR